MEILFLNFGGYYQDHLEGLLSSEAKKIPRSIFSEKRSLFLAMQKPKHYCIFTEFVELNMDAREFVQSAKSITKNITIINKTETHRHKSSLYLEVGFDYCFDASDPLLINYFIRSIAKVNQDKLERDMLLHQLESSFRELQFQKFAIDQSAMLVISDRDYNITYVNERFRDTTGFSMDEIMGKSHRFLNEGNHNPDSWKKLDSILGSGNTWKGEVELHKKDGASVWMELTIVPFFNESGEPYKFISILFDITYRILAEQQLTHDAFYDPHTGLPNRSLFLAKIEELIGKIHINPNLKLSVVIFNINQFNRINNMYGFLFGDRVIFQLAETLRDWKTQGEAFPSRIGGDSFGVLLISEDLSESYLKESIHQFLNQFNSPIHVEGEKLYIKFSVGISVWGEGGRDGEELVKNAELAMFRSKLDSGQEFVVFEKSMNQEIQKRVKLHAELKQAVKNSEILPYFQPMYSSDGFQLLGFEALVRWNHPEKGILTPYHFLEEAEESGLILQISEIVFRKSLDFLNHAISLSPIFEDLFMSINLSSAQFRESLVEGLDALIQSGGVEPSRIHLEITESLAMKDVDQTIVILKQFREKGFSISLDDFGTGYSSLSYLKIFPLDHLKIDKSFVDGIENVEKDREILEFVVDLGKKMGLSLVAEGVETEGQVKILQELQVPILQGYHFSKPLSSGDCSLLLQKILDNR